MDQLQNELLNVIEDSREKRFATLGISPENRTADPDCPLLGYCPHNAVVLARILTERWTHGSVTIQPGYLDLPTTALPDGSSGPYIFETVRQRGLLHFWVKADNSNGETYHLDLARETPSNHRRESPTGPTAGTPMVETTKPDGYIPVKNDYTINTIEGGDCPFDQIVLWNAIRHARDDYLSRWGITEEESDQIDGYCHEHAEVLLKTLISAWTGTNTANKTRATPYVQFGGVTSHINSGAAARTIKTADDANIEGCGHYWVVAPLKSPSPSTKQPAETPAYTADLYGQTEGKSGIPLATTGRPYDYRPVEDGVVPAGVIRQVDCWWFDHL